MRFIKITNWDKLQHYKKRNPPWIKLHTYLLDDEEFECLQDDSKLLLICLYLFAARKGNGEIPDNPAYLQRKLPVNKKVKLQPLIDAGFISRYQNDSNLLPFCAHDAIPETETEAEGKQRHNKGDFSLKNEFNDARKLFPGTKLGLDTEFNNFTKKHKKWRTIVPLLEPAIKKQIIWRKADGKYWKHLKTWINNACWEEEQGKSKETIAEKHERLKKAGEL
jgi:hypothetical protein